MEMRLCGPEGDCGKGLQWIVMSNLEASSNFESSKGGRDFLFQPFTVCKHLISKISVEHFELLTRNDIARCLMLDSLGDARQSGGTFLIVRLALIPFNRVFSTVLNCNRIRSGLETTM